MPKFTASQIRAELQGLSEESAAFYYLQTELVRRRVSAKNRGRPVKYDDERHVKDRARKAS